MKKLILALFLLSVVNVNAANVWTDLLGNEFTGPANFDVMVSDQTSPSILIPFTNTTVTTTLYNSAAIDDMDVEVTSPTGIVNSAILSIWDDIGDRFYFGHVLDVVTNTVTLDTPMDFAFPTGSTVGSGTEHLNVDGSSTTVIYTLRDGDPGVGITFDITNIIISMETDSAVDLSKFGDIAALTKGLVLRKVDGTTQNLGNIKSNLDMLDRGGEVTFFVATNPVFGRDGLSAVFRFAGQENAGVAIRIEPGDTLEILVQDNLAAITDLRISALGHIVVD